MAMCAFSSEAVEVDAISFNQFTLFRLLINMKHFAEIFYY